MKITWSSEAIEDLISLRAYIAEDNPAAARRTVQHIVASIEQLLPDNPRIGRAGRVPGTRELVIPRSPYIVPYRPPSGNAQKGWTYAEYADVRFEYDTS